MTISFKKALFHIHKKTMVIIVTQEAFLFCTRAFDPGRWMLSAQTGRGSPDAHQAAVFPITFYFKTQWRFQGWIWGLSACSTTELLQPFPWNSDAESRLSCVCVFLFWIWCRLFSLTWLQAVWYRWVCLPKLLIPQWLLGPRCSSQSRFSREFKCVVY